MNRGWKEKLLNRIVCGDSHLLLQEMPGNSIHLQAFLQILNDIEENKTNSDNYLRALFILLAREIIRSNSLLSKHKLNFQRKNLTIYEI